ncbi:MAG TPA: hypothetical protein VKV22_10535 [Rhodanobacteraceae bacterium]|nr:hypothetical protein [Rhodanobacteraceae bacterium]
MSERDPNVMSRPSSEDPPLPDVVPWGYRPGIITAITVFLAFSLAFLRYWGFEAPGRWRWYSVVSACVMAASVLLQLGALFRSLRLRDVQPAVYRVTVRWFVVAVAVMIIGVLLAAFDAALG